MTRPPPASIEEVDEATLRREFNIGQFEERAQRGELTAKIKPGSEHPAPAAMNEAPGTVSHILQYLDKKGNLVAKVHEYVHPDGSLGASGRRDPKWLRIGGRILKQRRKRAKT